MKTQTHHLIPVAEGILEHLPPSTTTPSASRSPPTARCRPGSQHLSHGSRTTPTLTPQHAELLLTDWPRSSATTMGASSGSGDPSVAKFGADRLYLGDIELSAWCAWSALFLPSCSDESLRCTPTRRLTRRPSGYASPPAGSSRRRRA